MAMSHNGLTKLMEECGEAIQIAAKMIAYPNTDQHPDGAGSMRARLTNELGDVTAAISFVVAKLGLDLDALTDRAQFKLNSYAKWDQEES